MIPSWQKVETRTLSSVGDVTLCAGLGAIVHPYVVAYTHAHVVGFAEVGRATRLNLIRALDLCLESNLFPSGYLCVFEHGGRSDSGSTGCLEHCHMHIVDGGCDLRAELFAAYPEADTSVIAANSGIVAESSYLFAGVYEGKGDITGLSVNAPGCGSQFFRRLLAKSASNDKWNWRLWPNPSAAHSLCTSWAALEFHLPDF